MKIGGWLRTAFSIRLGFLVCVWRSWHQAALWIILRQTGKETYTQPVRSFLEMLWGYNNGLTRLNNWICLVYVGDGQKISAYLKDYNLLMPSAVYNISINTGRDAYFGEKYAIKKVSALFFPCSPRKIEMEPRAYGTALPLFEDLRRWWHHHQRDHYRSVRSYCQVVVSQRYVDHASSNSLHHLTWFHRCSVIGSGCVSDVGQVILSNEGRMKERLSWRKFMPLFQRICFIRGVGSLG